MTLLLTDQPHDIDKGAALLKEGKLVAFPTETVYGLGASIFSPAAIHHIFHVKKRAQDNPLIAHIASIEEVALLAQNIPSSFERLAGYFFPGPLTIVLPKHERVPSIASAGLATIGIRMPNHPVARRLIKAAGTPLVAPSANLSGQPSSTQAQHVLADFDGRVAAIIDGGVCELGLESTVLALEPFPLLLRPGIIPKEAIEEVLGQKIALPRKSSKRVLSPGMKYRHYSPKAKLRLFYSQKELNSYLNQRPSLLRITFTSLNPKDLYASFRDADLRGFQEILVLCTKKTVQNQALMDRLLRASQ